MGSAEPIDYDRFSNCTGSGITIKPTSEDDVQHADQVHEEMMSSNQTNVYGYAVVELRPSHARSAGEEPQCQYQSRGP
eukprot:CAMPEP_0180616526 /NCGR_PEP_ID=MMETSP1037_2-20121125/32529_1 /TAXON_ID=632150 /ORGANISM="Azadinium spinosum, Strain 3D9" /LENGTH=77 /DNA_ID=CAMNT_0022636375 /DNA_START=5 /DNA_END=235 /DNA_ORIENTATION=-